MDVCLNDPRMSAGYPSRKLPDWAVFLNASFVLTIEVFLLTVRLFPFCGGTVTKEDQTDVHRDPKKQTKSQQLLELIKPTLHKQQRPAISKN